MLKVEAIGNLAAAPELKVLESGKRVATALLISDNGRGENAGTSAIRVTAWEHRADDLMAFGKGAWIRVSGSLKTERYAKDDEMRYSAHLVVRSVSAGPSKKETAA